MQQLANDISDANYHFVPFDSQDGKSWTIESLEKKLNLLI
jgi:hypothetical protein